MTKRLLSLLLALVTVFSLSIPAYAESGEAADVPEIPEAAEPVTPAEELIAEEPLEILLPAGLISPEKNEEPEEAAPLPVDEPEVLSIGEDKLQTLAAVKNGLVKDSDGVMRYYINGKVDTSKTGVAQLADKSSGSWYYVEKGVFKKATGIAQRADKSNTNWYYIKDGVYTKATGIAQKADKSSSAWYYVKNGVYTKATGIAQKADKSSSAWYYVKNGVYTKATGIAQKADKSSSAWYYVKNGVYAKATGVAQKADKSSSAWYYVKNGVYTKATGIAQKADKSSSAWYYVQNGTYLKTYTGLAPRIPDGKLFYVKNGAYLKTFNGQVTYKGTSYTVKNGAAVVPAGTNLATPQITSLTPDLWNIKITWNAVSGAEMYRVFIKDGGKWRAIVDTAETSYEWGGYYNDRAVSGETYTFTVRCINADGSKYTSSYDTAGKSIFFVEAEQVYSIKSVAGGVQLNWVTADGAVKYRVFYKTAGSSWKKAGDVEANNFGATGFIWTGAKSGECYAFTVRAMDKNGSYVSSYYDVEPSFVYEPVDAPEEIIDNSLAPPEVLGTYVSESYASICCKLNFKQNSGYGYQCYLASDRYFTVGLKETTCDYEWNGLGYVQLSFFYVYGSHYYKVRSYRTEGDTVIYGPWSDVGIVESVNFRNKLDKSAQYSYDVYFVDSRGTDTYSSCTRAIYIKTANPNVSTIDLVADGKSILKRISSANSSNYYNDVQYLRSDDSDWELRKVPGGYLGMLNFDDAGNLNVEVQEAGPDGYVVAKSFTMRVLDYAAYREKWINNALSASTNANMNPKEKMDAVVAYIRSLNFKYLTNVDETLVTLAANPNTPWFVVKRWDSATSPSMLALIAETIGGFEEVHNCYGDYPRGSEEWMAMHAMAYVVYEGEKYYYVVCPLTSTGDVGEVQMIDFSKTSSFTKVS